LFTYDEVTLPYLGTYRTGSMLEDAHLALNWFLDSRIGKQYDFVYAIEEDVRLVGASWHSFLKNVDAALQQPDTTLYPFQVSHDSSPDLLVFSSKLLRRPSYFDPGNWCYWAQPQNRWNAASQALFVLTIWSWK